MLWRGRAARTYRSLGDTCGVTTPEADLLDLKQARCPRAAGHLSELRTGRTAPGPLVDVGSSGQAGVRSIVTRRIGSMTIEFDERPSDAVPAVLKTDHGHRLDNATQSAKIQAWSRGSPSDKAYEGGKAAAFQLFRRPSRGIRDCASGSRRRSWGDGRRRPANGARPDSLAGAAVPRTRALTRASPSKLKVAFRCKAFVAAARRRRTATPRPIP